MSRAARGLALAALLGTSACILSITPTTTPVEHPPPVPDKYKGDAPPELVDAGIAGCQRAPSLDVNLYYCAKEEQWFRWALNRWYSAFAWNGNWFPVSTKKELPAGLREITPAPEEVKKSREERLKELEKELEKLDPEKAPEGSN